MEPTKVVVRYRNGKIIRGYTQNFFPNKPVFHVRPYDSKNPDDSTEVAIDDLKAVFFVRDFFGNPGHREMKTVPEDKKPQGRILEVRCTDGEVIIGTTTGYDIKRSGFFLFPIDPHWNNMKAYIVSNAVSNVRYR
jgi:small nuclear ribonucleoprotein (snRNP)-like protein